MKIDLKQSVGIVAASVLLTYGMRSAQRVYWTPYDWLINISVSSAMVALLNKVLN